MKKLSFLYLVLFCLPSNNTSLAGYYDSDPTPILPSAATSIPSDITLVYWDYYHTDADDYSRKIYQHRDLGHSPWVAGGIWTWNRFWTSLLFTLEASKACLIACKKEEVKNVFVTIW